ncbi:MAG: hypothetical protein J6I84_03575 [Bacilli bacterium]|nr:hypothetical protein [Bacilli bacterium]
MARRKKDITQVDLPVSTPEQIEQRPIGQVVTDAYLDFGNYINCHRHLANLDGVKVSYKRLIYTLASQFSHTSFNHTNTAIAAVASIHPHGLMSFNEMCATLVKSGVFEGEGSFGYVQIDGVVNEAANERYTYIKISDLYWDLMGDLLKDVPYMESPNGNPEPEYLPLPLPLGLHMKTLNQGLGVSISMIYPNFSAWSMYQAYIHDNPQLLEPNVDLILDHENSELARLWETGRGRVVYSYKISRYHNSDTNMDGILFETKDGTEIFTPKLKPFKKLVEDGKVYIEDITDYDSCKMVIYRIPGARGVTIDDIEALCRKCCFSAQNYNLNITNGETAFRIPLKAWIDYTYKRYIDLVVKANQRKIQKTEFDITVLEAIPVVANYILNINPKATDKEIEAKTGIGGEVLSTVLGKPISYLRKNSDTSGRVKELKEKLRVLKKFDPVAYTEEIIKRL